GRLHATRVAPPAIRARARPVRAAAPVPGVEVLMPATPLLGPDFDVDTPAAPPLGPPEEVVVVVVVVVHSAVHVELAPPPPQFSVHELLTPPTPPVLVVELFVGAGLHVTQKVLCFWGSWTNCSLKCRPCLLMGLSPLAVAVEVRRPTLITEITCVPPAVVS